MPSRHAMAWGLICAVVVFLVVTHGPLSKVSSVGWSKSQGRHFQLGKLQAKGPTNKKSKPEEEALQSIRNLAWGAYSESECGDLEDPLAGLRIFNADQGRNLTVFTSKSSPPFQWVVSNGITDGNVANVIQHGIWAEPAVNSLVSAWMRNHPVIDEEHGQPIFVDLGANLGFYTLWALASGYRTISVEVQPSLTLNLLASIALNSFETRARVYNHPISNKCGDEFDINYVAANSGATNIRGTGATSVSNSSSSFHSKPSVTICALLRDVDVSFMKIDIEGFEAVSINACPDFFSSLRSPKYLVMELNKNWISENELNTMHSILTEAGYQYCDFDAKAVKSWNPSNLEGTTTYWTKNTICTQP